MNFWWIYPILGAFVASATIVPYVRRLAFKHNLVDHPTSPRKKHKKPMPLAGGWAIFLSFFLTVLLVQLATGHFTLGEFGTAQLWAVFLGSTIIMLIGTLDDAFDLSPRIAILGPILAAMIAALMGIGFQKVSNPFGDFLFISEFASGILTFIWLMGMMYTTKFLDGLDGLATSVSGSAALVMSALALSVAFFQPDLALLTLIAAGSMLGFLLFNAPPAKIYLGDGGSILLGFLIGTFAIIGGSKVLTALLVMAIPILDTLFVILERIRRRRAVTVGDRLHLHHRLADGGWKPITILGLYVFIALLFGLLTLILTGLQKLIALLVLFCLMSFGIIWLNIRYEKST